MKMKTIVLILTLMTSVHCKDCAPTAEDLVQVLETEVDSYDQFVYGRYMEAEEGTCRRVKDGMSRLRDSFNQELYVLLDKAVDQLKTIQDTARGTDAEPCVAPMSDFLERDLKEEKERFEQCLNVPAAQMEDLRRNLLRDAAKYTDLKKSSKLALKNCLINLPYTCLNMTTECMDTHIVSFNSIAKDLTETRIVRGPCMRMFVEALLCFSKSIENFFQKALLIQRKTAACVSYEDNHSTRQSILAFATYFTANVTLLEQVQRAQRRFEVLNGGVVNTLGRYYELEKSAKMTYEFNPHDFEQRLNNVFAAPLDAVERVRHSKRHVWRHGNADKCCDEAIDFIRTTINHAASTLEACENELLVETREHIERVRAELGHITEDLTLMGDPTIVDCLNNGAILTENAVTGCYDLRLRQFQLDKQDALERVGKLMTALEHYNSTYFNRPEGADTLCGNSYLDRTKWLVDRILFQLNRCPYKQYFKYETPFSTTESYPTSTRHLNPPEYPYDYTRRPSFDSDSDYYDYDDVEAK